jgi:hypothetical protein
MVGLSNEKVDQILHAETPKTEPLALILRGIYTRYMRLFEQYYADIDTLNDNKVAELRKYHEDTKSLVKHYYMDIPHDICMEIDEFDKKCTKKLLGYNWHEYLFDDYEEFREDRDSEDERERNLKAEYSKEKLEEFYEEIGSVLRDGFGSGSKAREKVVNELQGMFFGQ